VFRIEGSSRIMALRLSVISEQRDRLRERSSIVFGVTGGSIGRALDNDWVLPDALRYLSGHHARVLFRQGAWYLEDISSNGIFVNEATTPLGRRAPCALHDGDLLRLGEYQVQVSIEAEKPLPPPGTGTLSQMSVDNVIPLHADMGQDDLGASLNIEALIPDSRAMPDIGPRGEPTALSAQQRLGRLRTAARARIEGRNTGLADMRSGLQAFCRGAGIDSTRLPVDNDARTLHLAGQLLREALLGLREVLRAQQAFREGFGLDTRNETEILSPLDRATDDYLVKLMQGNERRELDAVIQVRTSFRGAGAQVAAVDPALRHALMQFLSHLAPANIEAPVAGRGGTADPAASWERYRDVYMNLLHATGQELPHLFTEALAQAFAREADNRSVETFKPTRE
jgi:predicted component of type VI protein secretion system